MIEYEGDDLKTFFQEIQCLSSSLDGPDGFGINKSLMMWNSRSLQTGRLKVETVARSYQQPPSQELSCEGGYANRFIAGQYRKLR